MSDDFRPSRHFQLGQAVYVDFQQFENAEGVVIEPPDETGYLSVRIDIYGRDTPVAVPIDAVRPRER
jgi:transcription antitermination factor NusG